MVVAMVTRTTGQVEGVVEKTMLVRAPPARA